MATTPASKINKGKKRPPRILIYARPKRGKSLICATSKGLVIDPEHGTDWMDGLKIEPDTWDVANWQDVDEAWRFCSQSREMSKYDWVCLDGLTRMNSMALRYIVSAEEKRDLSRKPGRVSLPDRGKSGELMQAMMFNFNSLDNHGILYTAQERVMAAGAESEEDEDAEDAQMLYVPDLPKGVRSAVTSLVDVIGRLYVVPDPEDSQKIQRRLWVEQNISYDTGYRSGYSLPRYIPRPTIPRIVRALQQGKVS
jgi:hypothetical protein